MSISPISILPSLSIPKPQSPKQKFTMNWKEIVLIAATALAVAAAVTAFFLSLPVFGAGFILLSAALVFATFQVRKLAQLEQTHNLTQSLSDIHDSFQETDKKLRITREELSQTASDLKKEVFTFQAENVTLKATSTSLQNAVSDFQSQNTFLRTQITRLEQVIENGDALIEEQRTEFLRIKASIASESTRLAATVQAQIEATHSLQQTETSLRDITAQLNQAKTEHLALLGQYRSLLDRAIGGSQNPAPALPAADTDTQLVN